MSDLTLKYEAGVLRIIKSPFWFKAGPFFIFTVLFVLYFSPVLFSGGLLGYSDAVFYSMPNFYSSRTFWTNSLFSGFPVAADPQAQTWYPLAFLFSLFPNSWNAYMVSGYVLSAFFMYGYVWTVTQSRMAGLIAGISFSMGGFMIGRLAQVPLIHAAVWLPLIFIALEKTRNKTSAGWTVIGSFAIACSFLGGHTQIFFWGLIVAGAYCMTMGWSLDERRWSYFRQFGWMVLMGIGLVAIQLLPSMELAEWSARSELTYSDFVNFSLMPRDLLTLVFPYLFGGISPVYDLPFYGESNGMELPGYLGLLTLLLASFAVMSSLSNRVVRFWLIAALLAFVLALGEYTPLSQLMFHLPGFNKFRAPVRHFLEISMAVSVLAGIGADCVRRGKINSIQIKKVFFWAVGLFGVAFTIVLMFAGTWEREAVEKGMEAFQLITWNRTVLWVPVFVLLLAIGALAFWLNQPGSPGRRFLVLAVLVVDLGSYGWFHYWVYLVPPKQWIDPPEIAIRYRTLLNESHQRLIPMAGLHSDREQFPVNLSRLWGVSSAAGYNPLILSRVQKLLSIYESGAITATWSSIKHRALDILGVRYMFIPTKVLEAFSTQDNLQWTQENLEVRLGSGCDQTYPSSMEFLLPNSFSGSHIGIVSKSFCSKEIADKKPVLNIRLSGDHNFEQIKNFVVGRDTAEWAYDCPRIQEHIRHKQASVFQSVSINSPVGSPCHGFQYVTQIPVSQDHSWKRIQLEWLGTPGIVQLDKITLVDKSSGKNLPLRELTASSHWRFQEQIGKTTVYENLDAMPRAWLVPEAMPTRPQDILHAIYHSQLPDGRPFDPTKTALIEESDAFQAAAYDPSGKVDIVRLEDTEMVLQTRSQSESFLVTSDIYYPGWEATVDGEPVQLVRTDYVLRGIPLPAGSHEVRFEYHPRSFYTGMTITLFSFIILILWALYPISLKKKHI